MIITFLGHSSLNDGESLSKNIRNVIDKSVQNVDDVTFYCGGYGDFDSLCASVCHSVKEEKIKCEVVLVTPYITKEYQNKLQLLMDSKLYDSVIYPPLENVPLKYAISKRNAWMVDNADLIIAYVKYSFGGAYKSLEYARRKKKRIINLAEQL